MSAYELQKLVRDVNRDPAVREAFFAGAGPVMERYGLSDEERSAVEGRDYRELYRLGVHGLLLRPFSILHQVPEDVYLRMIRG